MDNELSPDKHEFIINSILFRRFYASNFIDNKQHSKPHIHVKYQEQEAVVDIHKSNLLQGSLPGSKMKLLQAWMEIHREELIADWDLAVSGQPPFKIEPLR